MPASIEDLNKPRDQRGDYAHHIPPNSTMPVTTLEGIQILIESSIGDGFVVRRGMQEVGQMTFGVDQGILLLNGLILLGTKGQE